MKNKLNGFLWIILDTISLILLLYFIVIVSISVMLDYDLSQTFNEFDKHNFYFIVKSQWISIFLLYLTSTRLYFYMVTYTDKENMSYSNTIFQTNEKLTYKNIMGFLIQNDLFENFVIMDFSLLKKETLYLKQRDVNINEFKEWFNKLFFN